MKKTTLFMAFFTLIMCFSLLPAAAQTGGDVNSDGSIDIIDALLVAQYYVGLNPSGFSPDVADVNCDLSVDILDALIISQYYVGIVTELPECPVGDTVTLTVEVDGRDVTVTSIDMPYIDPPDQVVNVNSKYIYETGTTVNFYLISSTPPPTPEAGMPAVEYQTAGIEDTDGTVSTNVNVTMDADKTVRIVYTTTVLEPPDITPEPGTTPYPTPTPALVGDGYLYSATNGIIVIEPEEPGFTFGANGTFTQDSSISGYTGSGYFICDALPSYFTFGVYASNYTYYEVRLRTWDPDTQSWTFDGYTQPAMIQFLNYRPYVRLDFSSTNYIVDRIVIFQEGTAESAWQDLTLGPTEYFTSVMDMSSATLTIK